MKKYEKIFNQIKSSILNGQYKYGEKIPTEMELCKMFGVSRVPVQQAINGLSETGFVSREIGRGTFVTYKSPIMEFGIRKVAFIMSNNEWESLKIIEGAQEVFQRNSIFLTTSFTAESFESEKKLMDEFINTDISGIILYPSMTDTNISTIYEILMRKFPMVFVDKYPEKLICSSVMTNAMQAMYLLVEHIFRKGHREIGFIGFNASHILSVSQRHDGFRNALEHFGLEYHENYVNLSSMFLNNLGEIMKNAVRPTAFVCASDIVALACIQELNLLGYRVPEDVSVVGHDDIKERLNHKPLLTTVRQPFKEIGKVAAEMLIDMLEKKNEVCTIKYMPVELIEGESVKTIAIK